MADQGRSVLHGLDVLTDVGPDRAAQLSEMGLGSVEELVAAGPGIAAAVGKAIPGLTEQQVVKELLPEGWFALLGELGSRAAASLVAAGISSYTTLMSKPTGRICSVLAGLDPAPAELDCAELQLAAAKAMLSFRVLLHVTSSKGQGRVPEVTVSGAGFDAAERPVTVVGDEAGWVLTPPLRRGREHLLAIHEGRNYRAMTVYAATVAPVQVHQVRFGAAPKGAVLDEPGDPVRFYSGSEVWVSDPVTSLKRLAPGTALLVGTVDESGRYRLTGAQRKYRAGIVTVPAVNVDADKLPVRTKVGDLVVVAEDHSLRKAAAAERRKVLSARGPLRGMSAAVR